MTSEFTRARPRDGATDAVLIRDARPGDAPLIRDLFVAMTAMSRARRFGGARGGLSLAESAAMARGGASGAGLIALESGAPSRAVGLARYEREPGKTSAELAVAVLDGWQGRGVGTQLLARLAVRARADGIDSLWALVHPDNGAMMHVLLEAGGMVTDHYGADGTVIVLRIGDREAGSPPAVEPPTRLVHHKTVGL